MIDINYITPIVIEITLFQNNLRDNQLISALKHSTDLFTLPGDSSLFVSRQDMIKVLDGRFGEDIGIVLASQNEHKHLMANSPYFINKLVNYFNGLQYFKVVISKKQNFTRLKAVEDSHVIDLAYKTTYAKLDLTRILNTENLSSVKHLFEEAGILSKSKINKSPYIQISISDMFAIFGDKESEQQYFSEYFDDAINTVLEIIGPKLEEDNTNMLLIIEH
jgi:hypothetical protein